MIVLKATTSTYNQLNGFQKNASKLEFVKDGNGNWIVGLDVLKDPNFEEIYESLDALERIEYVPLIND